MPNITLRSLCAVLLLSVGAASLAAQRDSGVTSRPLDPAAAPNVPSLDAEKALALSKSVLGQPLGDFALLARDGQPRRLADYRGKPLLVSFIYTGCFDVCPTTTRNLQKAVTNTVANLGADRFNVVSIGFNQPFDSPSALKAFAAQNGIVFPNWEFLSPAAAIVDDLTKGFGFSFVATPAGFDHTVQVTLVDAEGKIVRQIYGEALTADMLVEPLKQLVTGAPLSATSPIADLLDRVRILCSVYDPKLGKYRLSLAIVFEIAGFLTFVLFIAWYLWRGWRDMKSRPG
ncbi:MAG: SCO family protein [Betaproteobacteria bacterium]|nr:SCO family protein [Betaproteobacteria bacterium]